MQNFPPYNSQPSYAAAHTPPMLCSKCPLFRRPSTALSGVPVPDLKKWPLATLLEFVVALSAIFVFFLEGCGRWQRSLCRKLSSLVVDV